MPSEQNHNGRWPWRLLALPWLLAVATPAAAQNASLCVRFHFSGADASADANDVSDQLRSAEAELRTIFRDSTIRLVECKSLIGKIADVTGIRRRDQDMFDGTFTIARQPGADVPLDWEDDWKYLFAADEPCEANLIFAAVSAFIERNHNQLDDEQVRRNLEQLMSRSQFCHRARERTASYSSMIPRIKFILRPR